MFRSNNHFINCLLFIWCTQIFVLKFASCDSCWSSDGCDIHATYYGEQNAIQESRSYKCDRVEDTHAPGTDLPPDSLHNYITTKNVSLNGCSAPLNAHTYGMEYLPNCDSLLAVTIERFQTDQLLALKCSRSPPNRLKYLKFKQNDVRVVDSRAFEQLVDLEQLSFISNTVQYIEQGAFDELRSLKFLSMENEQNYYLNVNTLFWNTSIEDLHLMALKGIHSEVFQNLPESLRDLQVEHTPIENYAIELENPKELSHISLTNCDLQRFILSDSFGSVLLVNLSGNALDQLDFGPNNLPIETLDLSFNHLRELPNEWISNLSNLRELLLHNNLIKTLSLEGLLALSPPSSSRDLVIDLSVNQLSSFKVVHTVRNSELFMLRLKVDRNPWNCMWLIEFSYKHPHLFHLFQYDKYISRINVNGLECMAVEQLPEADELAMSSEEVPSTAEKDENQSTHNTAHYVVGGPWEVKRNQRAEALIIVFMLPLGIAFLFLLLYLWIYCHKLFSLSYYQSMSKSHDTNDNSDTKPSTEVKPLTTGDTTNDGDGYEVPLNIDLPIYRQTLANDDVTEESLKKNYEVVYEVEKPKNGGLQPLYEYLPDY